MRQQFQGRTNYHIAPSSQWCSITIHCVFENELHGLWGVLSRRISMQQVCHSNIQTINWPTCTWVETTWPWKS